MDKPIPMPFAFVVKNGSNKRSAFLTQSGTGVAYRNHYVPKFTDPRLHTEYPRSSCNRSHGFDAIDDQIQQDLLQLDAITEHLRQSLCQFALQQDLIPRKLTVG